jgi:hypothetical protein
MKQNISISIISCVVLVTNYHKAIAQFASQDLSNLTWPTKINFSLLPDSTNKQNLGLSNKSWKDLYLGIRGTVYLEGSPFLSSGKTGIFNVMLGGSNGSHSAASYNTFLGCGAGENNLKADNNTFVGALAGNSSVSGKNNSFFGMSAGYYNAIGNYNSFYGDHAGFFGTGGNYNSFYGNRAGYNNYGNLNSFFGSAAGASNKDGLSNSFFGAAAGASNTTGNYNSFFGMSAGAKNYDGLSNSFFGSSAGGLNISGSENTSLGNNAGYSNPSSPYNVCVGSYSGYPMTGTQNTYIGTSAGRDYTTGNYNTCVGINAGYSALFERTGSSNTMIGGYTRVTASHSNSTALGYEAVAAGDNAVGIGNTSTTSIGGYQDWSNFSDGRYKKEIKENVPGLAFVNQLKPITYYLDVTGLSDYLQEGKAAENSKKVMLPLDEEQKMMDEKSRKEKEKVLYTGFVAQDVEAAAKKLNYDFSGVDKPQDANGLYKLRYAEFVVPLVKSVQELYTQNEQLKKQIELQQKQYQELKKEIELIRRKN